jgi:hypothetical protein
MLGGYIQCSETWYFTFLESIFSLVYMCYRSYENIIKNVKFSLVCVSVFPTHFLNHLFVWNINWHIAVVFSTFSL